MSLKVKFILLKFLQKGKGNNETWLIFSIFWTSVIKTIKLN